MMKEWMMSWKSKKASSMVIFYLQSSYFWNIFKTTKKEKIFINQCKIFMGAIDVFLIDYIFLRDWVKERYTRKHETLIKESCC